MPISENLLRLLVCPRDHVQVENQGDSLVCQHGHRYPVVDGVPIMLVDGIRQTQDTGDLALNSIARNDRPDNLFLDVFGWDQEKQSLIRQKLENAQPDEVDPVIQLLVAHTSGNLYRPLVGKMREYPIPEIRLPTGTGNLLDIGCNWGRWCVAATRNGYRAIGIDPSIGAVMAARRMNRQLGVDADFVVGDARHLPFRDDAFSVVFSYSVIQHFSRADARSAIAEAGRVLSPGGRSMVQMPNVFGIRSMYNQIRRGRFITRDFDVRFWFPWSLAKAFRAIGKTRLEVDGFFGLGSQPADAHMLPPHYRAIVRASERLRRIARKLRPLTYAADSLYVVSTK